MFKKDNYSLQEIRSFSHTLLLEIQFFMKFNFQYKWRYVYMYIFIAADLQASSNMALAALMPILS